MEVCTQSLIKSSSYLYLRLSCCQRSLHPPEGKRDYDRLVSVYSAVSTSLQSCLYSKSVSSVLRHSFSILATSPSLGSSLVPRASLAISISLHCWLTCAAMFTARARDKHIIILRDEHVDDVSLHTYIHKYSDFLVVLNSVGLASARPNYSSSTFNIISH